uniref:Protein kinase domain-containing protein n=1 Tax=Panagrolaimus sp. ES5 TaxID=591445 RepID=A0AC34EZB2_9BILA
MTENGKNLFIDSLLLQVDYKNPVGKGSSAIIYKGHLNTAVLDSAKKESFSDYEIVVKILEKFGQTDYEQLFREVDAGEKLGWHPHICYLLGWSIYKSTPALIFEAIDGNDLHTWVKTTLDEEITEKKIAQILWQISDDPP